MDVLVLTEVTPDTHAARMAAARRRKAERTPEPPRVWRDDYTAPGVEPYWTEPS